MRKHFGHFTEAEKIYSLEYVLILQGKVSAQISGVVVWFIRAFSAIYFGMQKYGNCYNWSILFAKVVVKAKVAPSYGELSMTS